MPQQKCASVSPESVTPLVTSADEILVVTASNLDGEALVVSSHDALYAGVTGAAPVDGK